MKNQGINIGTEVIRKDGQGYVGRIGTVLEIDEIKNRVRVQWLRMYNDSPEMDRQFTRTWVSEESIAPTSIPYEIEIVQSFDSKCKVYFPSRRYQAV